MEFTETEVNKFEASSKPVFIDADSMLYYSMPLVEDTDHLSNDEAFELVKASFLDLARTIREACNSSGKVIYFFSCSRNYNYRLHFDREYKANREARERPKFVKPLKDFILDNYSNAVLCENVEADDAVAFMWRKHNGDCIICSPDKDVLNQLPGEHFDYRKQAIVTTKGKDADRFLYLQMLAGDPTDGIKGLPKVGLKTADKLLSKDPSFNEVVKNYIEKGFTKFDAKTTAYLVDISRIERASFAVVNNVRTFRMDSLSFIY